MLVLLVLLGVSLKLLQLPCVMHSTHKDLLLQRPQIGILLRIIDILSFGMHDLLSICITHLHPLTLPSPLYMHSPVVGTECEEGLPEAEAHFCSPPSWSCQPCWLLLPFAIVVENALI